MTDLKDEFLKLRTYEEFDRNRNKFKGLKPDKEVLNHCNVLFGKCYVGGDIKHGITEDFIHKKK